MLSVNGPYTLYMTAGAGNKLHTGKQGGCARGMSDLPVTPLFHEMPFIVVHYSTAKGALIISPSPPRIAPSQLRLVE